MNKQTEALKMAIDFLDGSYEAHKVRKACQEALEQPIQEPVALVCCEHEPDDKVVHAVLIEGKYCPPINTPLYTHPAPSWVGLSDDEIRFAITKATDINLIDITENEIKVARAIEAKLKEKNHGTPN